MAKAKRLSFLNSFQICRPKNPSSMIKSTLSPLNPKSFDISFPSSTSLHEHSKPKYEQKMYNSPVSSSDSDSDDDDEKKKMVRPIGPSRTKKKRDENRKGKSMRVTNDSTFVVVKRSVDPKEDFKKSMLEMIVEKEMFEPRELEHLLMSFLSLNSRLHHRVIIEAFTEILKQVFS
ncbi:hypothetical protein CDL12_18553 [Handroanthus impetiginosus]|uniref:Transcription repressor n=1 Tax=Handroanthus impetiginosus TaxID=429701 RepID=A0A2G9GUA0_9LAMI|nr:hypothetical protein CDL12_18553 [Handroanthus impetiginosus]